MILSRFIIVQHTADRAGIHYDLRFKKPSGSLWDSFAVRKEIPFKPGIKVLAIKTHDHTEKDALTTKPIESGYGKGTYKKVDDGSCVFHKYTKHHIIIEFKGSKYKGIYHLINTGVASRDKYKEQKYFLFKQKEINA